MFQQAQPNGNLPLNNLKFHENAFVSPLNLINITHPAPISFGRAPHFVQQIVPQSDSTMSSIQLQSIDTNKLHMYQFLAKRKLKEDQWKKQIDEKTPVQSKVHQRNARSATPQQHHPKKTIIRPSSAPKKPVISKIDNNRNEIHRSQITPSPIHITRPSDPYSALSAGKQHEITEVHEQLCVQLRILHNPPPRENIIDETEQEKQRRIRLKRERIRRDSRALYNARQELKQILNDALQPDANLPRLIHRHLNAYKAILLAAETLANEAPLKPQDTPIQQLLSAIVPVLETLTNTNHSLGLSQLQIDHSLLQTPTPRVVQPRTSSENRVSSPAADQLLPTVYHELIRKKQQKQRKPRIIPSVLRPRSAEPARLPRIDKTSITRPTISAQSKTRARSHSPLPSVRFPSSVETPFYSRFTVDHILGKLAPCLLTNYTGRELSEQIERARVLIPMFLVDNRLTDDEIVSRVMQMLMPKQPSLLQQQRQQQDLASTTGFEVLETPEERSRRTNLDMYQTQISTWEDEMAQIRQRIQNYKTNRLEHETSTRRTVRFKSDPIEPPALPENVHIHRPLLEDTLDDLEAISREQKVIGEKANVQSSSRGSIKLNSLDSSKVRQIDRYRKDYRDFLRRTEAAKIDDFDPCQIINRLSEFLLDEALLTVVNEIELFNAELGEKLVENELLGREVSLDDVERHHRRHHQHHQPKQQQTIQQHYPPQRVIAQFDRKRSPESFSSPNERYTSSFEEDINSESRISHSDEDHSPTRRKSPLQGTGHFVISTAEVKESPRRRRISSSPSSSSSSTAEQQVGTVWKPTTIVKNLNSAHESYSERSDDDVDESVASHSEKSQSKVRHYPIVEDHDDELLLSSRKTGEKLYSTDFEDSRSKHRSVSYNDDEDDIADTMKLSARSTKAAQRRTFDSDDDDDDEY